MSSTIQGMFVNPQKTFQGKLGSTVVTDPYDQFLMNNATGGPQHYASSSDNLLGLAKLQSGGQLPMPATSGQFKDKYIHLQDRTNMRGIRVSASAMSRHKQKADQQARVQLILKK